jgi:hypothetical protein
MIRIYQIQLTNEEIDQVNLKGCFSAVPAALVKTRMGMGFNHSKFSEDYIQYYRPVYEVDTNDLDVAFEATNLWEGTSVRCLSRGSSSSVGDIFVNDEGDCFIVDNFGFVAVGHYDMPK